MEIIKQNHNNNKLDDNNDNRNNNENKIDLNKIDEIEEKAKY